MSGLYPELVQTRISENQLTRLVDAAKADEVTVSQFVRDAVKRRIKATSPLGAAAG